MRFWAKKCAKLGICYCNTVMHFFGGLCYLFKQFFTILALHFFGGLCYLFKQFFTIFASLIWVQIQLFKILPLKICIYVRTLSVFISNFDKKKVPIPSNFPFILFFQIFYSTFYSFKNTYDHTQ